MGATDIFFVKQINSMKSHIEEIQVEASIRSALKTYMENQARHHKTASLTAELDLEGLYEYVLHDLLNDVKNSLFNTDGAIRMKINESILSKAYSYAQANTPEAQDRTKKIIRDSTDIIMSSYKEKISISDKILTTEAIESIKKHFDRVANELASSIISFSRMQTVQYPNVINICDRINKVIEKNCPKMEGAVDNNGKTYNTDLLCSMIYNNITYDSTDENALCKLLNDDWSQGKRNLRYFIKADGGFGKTTNLLLAAKELNAQNVPTIYIACNQIDNQGKREREYFIFKKILFSLTNESIHEPDENDVIRCIANSRIPRVVVLLDGLNEAANATTLINQIRRLKDFPDDISLQIIIASRYIPTTFQLHSQSEEYHIVKIKNLDAKKILKSRQMFDPERYKQLQDLLTVPMFLKLYIDANISEGNDSTRILCQVPTTASGLLLYDHIRTMYKECRDDSEFFRRQTILNEVLPAFTCHRCRYKMHFSKDELYEFCCNSSKESIRQFAQPKRRDELIQTLVFVGNVYHDISDNHFYYNHEYVKDFLSALYIYREITSDRIDDSIAPVFKTALGTYVSSFITGLFKEENTFDKSFVPFLDNQKTLFSILIQYRNNRSVECQVIIAAIFDLIKIAYNNELSFATLKDLDLRQTTLNGLVLRNVSFHNCLINESAFLPMGHSSAPFIVLLWSKDEKDSRKSEIISISRNEIIRSTIDLKEIASAEIENNACLPVSSTIMGNILVTIMDANRLPGGRTVLQKSTILAWELGCPDNPAAIRQVSIQDIPYNAHEVIAVDNGLCKGFLVGLKDGSLVHYDYNCNNHTLERIKSYPLENAPIYPLLVRKDSDRSELLYKTNFKFVILNTKDQTRKVLWSLDDIHKECAEITQARYDFSSNCCIFALSDLDNAKTVIYSLSLDSQEIQTIDTYQNENTWRLLTQCIYPNSCNDICVYNGVAIISHHNAIHIYQYNRKIRKWQSMLTTTLCRSNYEVFSACFAHDGIACALSTGRSIRMLNYSKNALEESGNERYTLEGHNNGLHTLCKIQKDCLIVTMYDFGFLILKRGDNNLFCNARKVRLPGLQQDDPWCWTVAKLDIEGEYFVIGASNKVYFYQYASTIHFPTSLILDDGASVSYLMENGKIESLISVENHLYIATAQHLIHYSFKIEGGNLYLFDKQIIESDSKRRALSFARDPINNRLFVGYNSIASNSQTDEYGNSLIKEILPLADGNKKKTVPIVQWLYEDGWFRHMEFSADGKYLLCAGLRAPGSQYNHLAVIYETTSWSLCARLVGHTNDLIFASFGAISEEGYQIATCGYDGCINLYYFNPAYNRDDTEIAPSISSGRISADKLFNLFFDDNYVLATCLDGSLIRWNYQDGSVESDYKNDCGLWAIDCDFSKVSPESNLGIAASRLAIIGNKMI